MKCPYCGNEHRENAKFCPISGKSLESAVTACPNCGQALEPNLSFCPSCGELLSKSSDTIPPILQSSPPEKIVPIESVDNGKTKLFYLYIGLLSLGVVLIIGGIYIIYQPGSDNAQQPQAIAQDFEPSSSAPITNGITPPTLVPEIVIDEFPTETPFIASPTTEVAQSMTPVPTPTATLLPTPTHTSEPENQPISLEINPIDGAEYVLIPGGEFLMGSEPDKDPYFWGAESPEHIIFLDEFWIYRTEVTNGMYQACVEQQKCPRPQYQNSVDVTDYYGNPEYAAYPVIHVTFTHAQAYCNWVGGKLPSEAQWEKAARGTEGLMFPWGDDPPNADRVNLCDSSCARGNERENHFSDGFPGTSPVGSFPDGASPYGVLDMAGNVWEWTFDWFQPSYYSISPDKNPLGPASGTTRTIRGGSWFNPTSGVRAAARTSLTPPKLLDTLGFRCVVEQP